MNSPEDSLEFIRRRLSPDGQAFVLRDAVDAMEASYREDRLGDEAEDSVIALCTRPKEHSSRIIEIGICRMFGLFNQLEVSLQYPANWRSFFLKRDLTHCAILTESAEFFAAMRRFSWYRRYATVKAMRCTIRWHDDEAMSQMLVEQVLPIFANQDGSELCRLARLADQPEIADDDVTRTS